MINSFILFLTTFLKRNNLRLVSSYYGGWSNRRETPSSWIMIVNVNYEIWRSNDVSFIDRKARMIDIFQCDEATADGPTDQPTRIDRLIEIRGRIWKLHVEILRNRRLQNENRDLNSKTKTNSKSRRCHANFDDYMPFCIYEIVCCLSI